jgi:hypothetical protein
MLKAMEPDVPETYDIRPTPAEPIEVPPQPVEEHSSVVTNDAELDYEMSRFRNI